MPIPTASDREFLDWAERVYTGRCMTKAGFEFYVDWARDADVQAPPGSSYGSADVDWAGKYGYGIQRQPPKPGPARSQGPNAGYIKSLPDKRAEEYKAVLNGTKASSVRVPLADGSVAFEPRDGCTAAGRRELYGDFDRWFQLNTWVTSLEIEIAPVVVADARYRTALSSWQRCMAAGNHPAKSPGEARRQVSEAVGQASGKDAAQRLEIEVATVDAGCSASSGLVKVADQLDAEARARLRETRHADFAEYEALQANAARRARELYQSSTRTHASS